MRLAKQAAVALLAVVLAAGGMASGQVVKQLPSTTLAFLKVSNLDATNKKIAALAQSLGLAQMQPAMADPLGAFLKSIGVTQGVNLSGEMAMAYLDAQAYGVGNDQSLLMLIPVSDYQQFIGNFPDAQADGALMDVHFKSDPAQTTYVAHWGDYAAASPDKEIVAKPPTAFLEVAGMSAKELDGKDAIVYGNVKAVRARALAAIADARVQAAAAIDKAVQEQNDGGAGAGSFSDTPLGQSARGALNIDISKIDITKVSGLAKVVVTQALNVAQEMVQDTNAVTLGIALNPDGIGTTALADFEPDSPAGKHVAAMKNTDGSLLSGLPDGKYLLFGGGLGDNKDVIAVVTNLLTPVQAAITGMGPDYKPINDYIAAVMKMAAATTGQQVALLALTAAPGQGSLVQMIVLRKGDAKAAMEATHEMCDAQAAMYKALGLQMPITTYIPAAKTVAGVTFDEMQSVPPAGGGRQVQQMNQMMAMIYGPGGAAFYTGLIDDQTLMLEAGLDDATLSSAVAAAKGGDDPLAKSSGVKTVAAQLPAQRMSVMYVPLDLWATTGLNYAKQFGMDMNVTLPDNLPPVGMTLSTDGTALRADSYVPSQLIQSLTAAGMQIYMKMQGGMNNPNSNPGGGAGGGL